jgi:peptidoglycan hydrolase CwlO-like protein
MEHVHHHVTVDVTDRLHRVLEDLADKTSIERQLNQIQRSLNKIMATEQELDDKLTELGTSASEGFASVQKAVSDAADRVIKALQANSVDLTDEVAAVEGIKTAVSDAAAQAVANLAQIAPDNVPAPGPSTEPSTTE